MSCGNSDEIKVAIGKMLLGACALSKKVISAYDFSASRTSNIKAISKFKLEMLEPCAEFLNIPLADAESNKIYTKDSLVSRILLAIEALLPATCAECSTSYCIELEPEETPLFTCFMCFQGSHDCDAVKSTHEALNSTSLTGGHVWLCYECHLKSNPVNIRKTKSRHVSISEPPSRDAALTVNSEQFNSNINHEELRAKLHDVAKTNLCDKYVSGKCPHGLKGNKLVNGVACPHNHPKRCFKYCGFGSKGPKGCKKGESCSFFHPTLCKHSVQKRCCTNASCTFVHLKGTSRKEPVTKNNPNVTQNDKSKTVPNSSHSPKDYTNGSPVNHFLELQELIKQMNSTFQQEISSIKISLQHQQSQMKFFSPRLSPAMMIPQTPCHYSPTPQHQTQFHPTYIPPSSL